MWSKFNKCLGYAWALPLSILGFAYVYAFEALGWYKWHSTKDDALVWCVEYDSLPDYIKKLWVNWEGHAVGNVIVLRYPPEEKPAVFQHELAHVRQSMRLGVFHPLIYTLVYLGIKWGCDESSDPYWSNIFEVDARRSAGQLVDVEGTMKKLTSLRKK